MSALRQGRHPRRSGLEVFLEPRHQLDEIARPVADVELVDQDFVPSVLAGAGRARQREEVGAVGDARAGARMTTALIKGSAMKYLRYRIF